jgi:hypothetical protein
MVLSLAGSIIGGIINFLGIGSNKRRNYANKSDKNLNQDTPRSQEGARKMQKFKTTAEDVEYEMIGN